MPAIPAVYRVYNIHQHKSKLSKSAEPEVDQGDAPS